MMDKKPGIQPLQSHHTDKKHIAIRNISHNSEARLDIVSESGNHATVTTGQVAAALNARFVHHRLLYQLG